MEKLITIVIPTYNMEKYLDKCLTSLIVPDEYMELLEVLVVNDGSKDNSSAIAHRYEDKYPQTFRVIDKENGNYGSCVNRGLKEATGKYIKILDADDYFNNTNWECFLTSLKCIDSDLILTDFIIVDENDLLQEEWVYDIIQKVPLAFKDIAEKINIQMHAVTYKRKLLTEMKYHQTEGLSYTDTEWIMIPMMKVCTVYYNPICIYHYLQGRTGQTVSKDSLIKKYPERLRVNNGLLDFCISHELFDKEVSAYFFNKLLGFYSETYNRILIQRNLKNLDLKQLDNWIKKCKVMYDALGKLTYSKIEFVEIWRNNHYKIPMKVKVLISLIRYKQKYFPNISLGWIH